MVLLIFSINYRDYQIYNEDRWFFFLLFFIDAQKLPNTLTRTHKNVTNKKNNISV